MENITPATNLNYLFSQRLNFITTKEEFILKCQQSSQRSMQSFAQNVLNEMKSFNGDLKSDQQIANAYKLIYGLIYHCRFNKKNLEQTLSSSREQIKRKMKKLPKDVQGKREVRIKKALLGMGLPQEDCDDWHQVLNFKNLSLHVSKAKIYLKTLFEKNFQQDQSGIIIINHDQIENEVKIRLCVLIVDIISLINTMNFMFYPFSQNGSLLNKIIQEQKILFDQAINRDGLLNNVNALTTNQFYDVIRILMTQSSNQEKILQFWYQLEQIRLKYLVKQNGIIKNRFFEVVDQNSQISFTMKQLYLEWKAIQTKYFQQNNQPFSQDLSFVFDEFSNLVFSYLNSIISEEESRQIIENDIADYLTLIRQIWGSLDEKSASELYLKELQKINNKFKLSDMLVNNQKYHVFEKINRKVQQFSENKKTIFSEKLKSIAFDLSKKIVTLSTDDGLIENYFDVLHKNVVLMLKQNFEIQKRIEEIVKDQNITNSNQLLAIISNLKSLLQDNIQQRNFQVLQNENQNYPVLIKSLQTTFPNQKDLINDIKFFLTTVQAFSDVQVDEDELQNAKEFYTNKKLSILSSNCVVNRQNFAKLTYGLLDFIRILIYELILKMRLRINQKELDHDQKIIQKLLKFYFQKQENLRHLQRLNEVTENGQLVQISNQPQQFQQQLVQNEELQELNYDNEGTNILLRRISSQEINFDDFLLNLNQEDNIITDITENQSKSRQFALNFLTKIYELRMEIIRKNIKQFQLKQKPLKQDYLQTKNHIYQSLITTNDNESLRNDIRELADIQYQFIKRRHYPAWRTIKKIQIQNIKEITNLLQKINKKSKNIIRVYLKIYVRYQEIYFNSQLIRQRNDITANEVNSLIDYAILNEPAIMNSLNKKQTIQFINELKNSVRILDRIEKVQILRNQIQLRDAQRRNLQEINQYITVQENIQYQELNGRLKIYRVQKSGIVMMRKYQVICPNGTLQSIQNKLTILRELGLHGINIKLIDLNKIQLVVDETTFQFDSVPKLIKHLIETYCKIIIFCENRMNFNLYPLLTKKDFKYQRKDQNHHILKINPYEGIILNVLLNYQQLKRSKKYNYPKYPFVHLANQLQNRLFNYRVVENLYFADNNFTQQEFAFNHLLVQMKSISLENGSQQNISETMSQILKCPYFWSYTQKNFELVDFKERYQSMYNSEEQRRKQNERIRRSLDEQREQTFGPQHQQYKKSFGYSKTTQMYFSIEGVMQKQAFLEDIGNFRNQGDFSDFRFQSYYWAIDRHSQEKKEINKLIRMTAQKQRNRTNLRDPYYKLTFPSFNAQMRNLRNMVSHYTYDKTQRREYSLEYKLSLIEKSFPKLFVFIYRWKPYLNKNFEQIQQDRIKLLLSLFKDQNKHESIERILSIKVFKQNYQIFQKNQNLLNFFNYKQEYYHECQACKILLILMSKKSSIWQLISDYAQIRQDRSYVPYNYLYYEHKKYGCNGMQFLLPYYFNTIKRNKFTFEEAGQMTQQLGQLLLQIERLQHRVNTLRQEQNEDDDNSSENSSQEIEQGNEENQVQNQYRGRHYDDLNQEQKQQLLHEMVRFDYVNKNFIYQFQLMFPHLFDDLRKERYLWDIKANKFDR